MFFVTFQHKFIRKSEGFSVIQTRIVGVKGKHADHLTTTTALLLCIFATALLLIFGLEFILFWFPIQLKFFL